MQPNLCPKRLSRSAGARVAYHRTLLESEPFRKDSGSDMTDIWSGSRRGECVAITQLLGEMVRTVRVCAAISKYSK